ncbi:hypothetical protein EIN_053580 [Entamoeba invadens IP1]|uniref:hypothetical protein n=1 Tax=Entamoeba invadens IP1 TaxID=370355 RepID=UPI0002C3DC7A|nr:hypothetical protein EIN_053580 [Entamoeba invadens IP1]ELP93113.1 hypothetical protein EIN_053580 [Entamoeba invadens IP1]|eukprot:XP_004259884.1 hypothetical protein EIN_053580 [Entamoeba invadens IP1]
MEREHINQLITCISTLPDDDKYKQIFFAFAECLNDLTKPSCFDENDKVNTPPQHHNERDKNCSLKPSLNDTKGIPKKIEHEVPTIEINALDLLSGSTPMITHIHTVLTFVQLKTYKVVCDTTSNTQKDLVNFLKQTQTSSLYFETDSGRTFSIFFSKPQKKILFITHNEKPQCISPIGDCDLKYSNSEDVIMTFGNDTNFLRVGTLGKAKSFAYFFDNLFPMNNPYFVNISKFRTNRIVLFDLN